MVFFWTTLFCSSLDVRFVRVASGINFTSPSIQPLLSLFSSLHLASLCRSFHSQLHNVHFMIQCILFSRPNSALSSSVCTAYEVWEVWYRAQIAVHTRSTASRLFSGSPWQVPAGSVEWWWWQRWRWWWLGCWWLHCILPLFLGGLPEMAAAALAGSGCANSSFNFILIGTGGQ